MIIQLSRVSKFRSVGLFAVFVAGFGSIIASGGGGGGGDGNQAQDNTPVVTTVNVSPTSLALDVGETRTLNVTVLDQNGQVMNVASSSITWSNTSDNLITTVDAGDVTGQIAGTDTVVVSVSGATRNVSIDVTPTLPAIADTPILWPLDSMKSGAGPELLAQDFREANDVSTEYHTGLDIRGDIGADILSPAWGWVAFMQLDKTAGECPTSNCDHDMGNTVILGHTLSNGETVYTLYSHMDPISEWLLNGAGYETISGVVQESVDYPGVCEVNNEFRRSTCRPGALWAGENVVIGELGYTGLASAADAHLHFEVKTEPYLSSSSSTHEAGEWGYSAEDPESVIYTYKDPIHYLEIAGPVGSPYEIVVPTTDAIASPALPLRMGPGRYDADDTPDERQGVDGDYTAIDPIENTSTRYEIIGSAYETSNCSDGWYQLRRVDGQPHQHDLETQPGPEGNGEIQEAWACAGHNGVDFFVEPADLTVPTTPTNLAATADSSNRIQLTWEPSTDDVGLAGYEIERNGVSLGLQRNVTEYIDGALQPQTLYCYTVAAVDLAGNVSVPRSNEACATTGSASLSVTLESIINPTVGIPNTTNTFSYIEKAVLDEGRIAFIAGVVSYGPEGTYILELNGELSTVHEFNSVSVIPLIALDGDSFYYETSSALHRLDPAGTVVVIRENDAPPIVGPQDEIGRFREIIAEDGNLALRTSNGIFNMIGNNLTWIANRDTIPPGQTRSFWGTQFINLAFDGSRTLFQGYNSIEEGIYEWTGSSLTTIEATTTGVVDYGEMDVSGDKLVFENDLGSGREAIIQYEGTTRSTLVDPDGAMFGFDGRIDEIFISGDRIAFKQVTSNDEQGIYVLENGVLTQVFRINDLLDGQSVQSFQLVGFEGNTVVFIARWSPGYSDLYKATLSR